MTGRQTHADRGPAASREEGREPSPDPRGAAGLAADGALEGEPSEAGPEDARAAAREPDLRVPSELELVASERDEYLDALRRLQAEFENYRKRTARQQSEAFERAAESLIERLLPALDALDLALAHAGRRDEPPTDVELAFAQIGSLFRDVLAKEGLERIDSTGVAFDPTVHDAVAHVPAEEGAELPGEPPGPAVVETLRTGYRLKGRVLRPAMVKVRA
ncbi:MAG: nucleotide exchange factor GrpE [Actinomycetota bacterium]|nr:nucleotide exchange factor GrpE [Actinomycetota bacterium]